MKNRLLLALSLVITTLFAADASAQLAISVYTNTPYSQSFDTLATNGSANAWLSDSTLPGWYANKSVSPSEVATYRASTGSDATTGAIYSFGSAASTERALGSVPTGTPGNLAYGIRFTNDTSRAMSNITVNHTGEQWRRIAGGGIQTLAFSYGVGSTAFTNADAAGTIYSWTSVGALDFNSPNQGATGGLDGNVSTNRQVFSVSLTGVLALPGQELFLRWLDVDDSGSDYGMGIDDFSVSFTPVTFVDPTITIPPVARTNAVYTTATFSVIASGLSTLSYQWYQGASPLSDGGNISGATNDTLTLSQVIHTDAANYSVVVSNASGVLTSAPAALTVVGFAIAQVPPTNTLAGSPVSVGLSFIDNQTPVNSASGVSSNQAILPDANISAAAAGNTGSATLTPLVGTDGVVLTSLTASDGSFATNTIFPLLVVPNTNVLFNDHFDYVEGSLTEGSHGLWVYDSGTLGDMVVSSGELQVSRSLTEDVHAELIGQPYTTTSDAVLYSRFKLRMTTSPANTGGYLAFFRDAAGTGQRARIWASVANTNSPGSFRLGIGNGSASSATSAQVDQDLKLGTNYVIITRLDVSNAVASIWINPTSELDTNSTNFATATDIPTSQADITSYAFRQAGSMGIMLVDDLVVGKTFASVAVSTSPIPVQLNIAVSGGNAIVSWTDPSGLFKLAASTNVTSITNVVATTSPYTNSATGQRYYRLIYP